MTKLIFALCLLGSSAAMAYPSANDMRENFKTCSATGNSWYQRFGKYIISFDANEAADYCRQHPGSSQYAVARSAGCYVNGTWLAAGFYCEGQGR